MYFTKKEEDRCEEPIYATEEYKKNNNNNNVRTSSRYTK